MAGRCKVCGAAHATCRGAAGALIINPVRRVEGSAIVGLHEYNVPNGNRRNPGTAQLLLSEEDAKAMGLTDKDRVSSKDQTVQGSGSEFAPSTEAELAGAPAGAPARSSRARSSKPATRGGAKQRKAPANKSAAPAASKDDAAAAAAAAPAGDGSGNE